MKVETYLLKGNHAVMIEKVKCFFKVKPIPRNLNGESLKDLGVAIVETDDGYEFNFNDSVTQQRRKFVVESFIVHSFAMHLTNSSTISKVYEHILCNEDVMNKLTGGGVVTRSEHTAKIDQ